MTECERVSTKETPLHRALDRVFRERLPQEPDVWSLFGALESGPQVDAHIRRVSRALGALVNGDPHAPSLMKLVEWHAEVRDEPGTDRLQRMTGPQFDRTLEIILEEVDAEGIGGDVRAAVGPSLPAIRMAIVDGIVAGELPPQ